MQKGRSVPGVVTGKPIEIGGTVGSNEASGTGLFYIIQALCDKLNFDLKSFTLAIQGFGKVGSVIAKLLHDSGCKVLAITDSVSGLYSEEGLDIDEIIQWKNETNLPFEEYNEKNMQKITNEELFKVKCDILIPAAIENQITSKNVNDINCKIIVEGADGPVTSKADKVLEEKEIIVVPDILANSGSACVSYFEYIQDIHAYFWTLDRVYKEMKRIMLEAFEEVWELSRKKKVSLRNAAYMLAISTVGKTHELRGLFP
jgi:glutamate dehydrogenase (NAD(P)+)